MNPLVYHIASGGSFFSGVALLPLHGDYGRLQRELSRKHGVQLIPKRIFLSILAPKLSTHDTIHLTPVGHQAMADEVWRILSPAFDSD